MFGRLGRAMPNWRAFSSCEASPAASGSAPLRCWTRLHKHAAFRGRRVLGFGLDFTGLRVRSRASFARNEKLGTCWGGQTTLVGCLLDLDTRRYAAPFRGLPKGFFLIWLWLKNPVPKWNPGKPGKWTHGPKPAVCPSW